MITSKETNAVFFSSQLSEKKEFNPFWKRLEKALKDKGIEPKLLTGTEDIWCRDYMPIQIDEKTLLQYCYDPEYLKTKEHEKTRSDVDHVIAQNGIKDLGFEIRPSKLILDGGNVITSKDKVILTEKVFTENLRLPISKLDKVTPEQKQIIIKQIKKDFRVKHVVIIPRLPGDTYGHADGIVRFYSENLVLINNDKPNRTYPQYFSRKLRMIRKIIVLNGLKIKAVIPHKDYNGNFYINYLQIGKLIFLPTFNSKKLDDTAISEFQELFGQENVVPVPSKEIAKHEGVLNCISWTIKL
jgi:agmatine deiminase